MIWVLLACSHPPTTVADCVDPHRDTCLANLAVERMPSDPEGGVAALLAISDPLARTAAGGALFANPDVVFDFATSAKICAALRGSYEEAFCQRRLGQGHLRARTPYR